MTGRYNSNISCASLANTPRKIFTSAPPEKIGPSARTTSARISDLYAWSTDVFQSARSPRSHRLSGGLLSVRMPTSPFVEKLAAVAVIVHLLALQLRCLRAAESMGNHDSKIVDACSVD